MGTGPFERLRQDHRRVLAETDAIEAAVAAMGPGGRLDPEAERGVRALLELLARQFATHIHDEDEIVFPALMRALPEARTSVAPLAAEHAELRAMLQALLAQVDRPAHAARDEQIAVQVRDLADLLRIHIRKEEAVVLSIAERVLSPAEQARLGGDPAGHDTPPHADRPGREAPRGTDP
jgi:hemerythrin-like domain-containing protein